MNECAELRDIWNGLASNCPSYFPWLTFEWFDLCINHFYHSTAVLVLLISREDNLVAIAPLFTTTKKHNSGVTLKTIEFIGSVHSPIKSFIIPDTNDDERHNILSFILHFFTRIYKNWDMIRLNAIPEENDVARILQQLLYTAGLKYTQYTSELNLYSDSLPCHFTHFLATLPKNLKRNIIRYRTRLDKLGNSRFQMKTDNDSIDSYFDLYDELRRKSWKAPEKDRTFNREFFKIAADNGWLRLALLFLDDNLIAAGKYIVHNRIGYGVDSVYDSAYAKYSPGTLLTSEIFKYLIDTDNVFEIDLGPGDHPYKREWTRNVRKRKALTIFNNSPKGQALAFLATFIKPILKKWRFPVSAREGSH